MYCSKATTSLARACAGTAARRGPAASTLRASARTFASSSSPSSSTGPRSRLAAALVAAAAATSAAVGVHSAMTGTSPLSMDSFNAMLLSASSIDCKSSSTPSYDAPTPIDMQPSSTMDFRHRGPGSFKDPAILDQSLRMSERMAAYTRELQSEIVSALESIERAAGNPNPTPFFRDGWTRGDGHGGGQSCVLANGRVFEKAGVMVTKMDGMLSPAGVKQMRAQGRQWDLPEGTERVPFFAAGISIVIHPHNPHAPTAHMNYRYFEIKHPHTGEPVAWWFGGGADLTPMVVDDEDATHFHAQLKNTCDRHLDVQHGGYPGLKKWCDEYFTLAHRGETRGVGGIFFDDFDFGSTYTKGMSKEDIFAFVRDAGRTFVPAYAPLVAKGYAKPYTHAEKEWQQLRRGRYVEFNLVYDRGTKFGLLTPGARIESILVSLPLTARWEYCHAPVPGSPEARTLDILKRPRDWMGVGVGVPLQEQELKVPDVKKVSISKSKSSA